MHRPCPPEREIYRGPRGAYYYLTKSGNKVYCDPITLQPLSPLYQEERPPVPPVRTIPPPVPSRLESLPFRPPLPPIPRQQPEQPPVPPPRAGFGYFQNLPADIRRTYLPPLLTGQTLLNLCQVSREYRQLCNNPQIWLQILQNEYGWTLDDNFLNLFQRPLPTNYPRILYEILKRSDVTGQELQTFLETLVATNRRPISLIRFYKILPLIPDSTYLIQSYRDGGLDIFLIGLNTPYIPSIIGNEVQLLSTELDAEYIMYIYRIQNLNMYITYRLNGYSEIALSHVNRHKSNRLVFSGGIL